MNLQSSFKSSNIADGFMTDSAVFPLVGFDLPPEALALWELCRYTFDTIKRHNIP